MSDKENEFAEDPRTAANMLGALPKSKRRTTMSDEENKDMAAENTVLVIASRVKALNSAAGFNTSAEYLIALSEEVLRLVQKGQRCAEKSGRKTLKAQDL